MQITHEALGAQSPQVDVAVVAAAVEVERAEENARRATFQQQCWQKGNSCSRQSRYSYAVCRQWCSITRFVFFNLLYRLFYLCFLSSFYPKCARTSVCTCGAKGCNQSRLLSVDNYWKMLHFITLTVAGLNNWKKRSFVNTVHRPMKALTICRPQQTGKNAPVSRIWVCKGIGWTWEWKQHLKAADHRV